MPRFELLSNAPSSLILMVHAGLQKGAMRTPTSHFLTSAARVLTGRLLGLRRQGVGADLVMADPDRQASASGLLGLVPTVPAIRSRLCVAHDRSLSRSVRR